jgi:hypothetical protein
VGYHNGSNRKISVGIANVIGQGLIHISSNRILFLGAIQAQG